MARRETSFVRRTIAGAACALVCAAVAVVAVREMHAQSNAAQSMTITQGDARINVTVSDGAFNVANADLRTWIANAADSVATYYGRFPVMPLKLEISPGGRNGVGHGMTWPNNGGGFIKIRVGADTTAKDFAEDWMLAHGMTPLGVPPIA